MGIIRLMKGYFRSKMHKKFIVIFNDTPDTGPVALTVVKCINLLETMCMVKAAWVKVTDVTI